MDGDLLPGAGEEAALIPQAGLLKGGNSVVFRVHTQIYGAVFPLCTTTTTVSVASSHTSTLNTSCTTTTAILL